MNQENSLSWPKIINKFWMIAAVVLTSFAIHFLWYLEANDYLGTLIMVTWAFVWAPVIMSYIFSAIIRSKELSMQSYDLNTIQRIIALLVANILNMTFSNLLEDVETAAWIFLIYLFIVIPVQMAMIIAIDLLCRTHDKCSHIK
ncbi:MAG: hypothetical protein K9M03_04595 [Kiritimatiellales bacterium]|nr:hypothetical protein [Kiritimatiellales bacterium]